MRRLSRYRRRKRQIRSLAIAIPCLLLSVDGSVAEEAAAADAEAAANSSKSLNLFLTREELRAITDRYAWIPPSGEDGEVTEEDDPGQVTVRAKAPLAPMRDPARDVPGGIAAPFWALAHPKDAWRIFLPIPPKPDRP